MSERGFIAVDRDVFDHPIFAKEPFTEREAWLWLIAEAAWSDRRIRVGSAVVELSRGQTAHSLRFMAARWKWSEARVRRYLGRLKNDAMIDAVATQQSTQITICNFDKYQMGRRTNVNEPDAPNDATATQNNTREQNTLTSDTKVSSVSVGSDEPTMAFEGMDKVPSSKPKRTKLAYSEAFEKFWGMYPKTPTMAKKEAWDVWRKMGEEDRGDATKSMPAYVRYCRQNPDYPPIHACRFLSKRRWEPLLEAQPTIHVERKEEDDAEFRRKLAEQWEGSDEERELEELRRIQGDIPSGRPLRLVPTERVELHPVQNGSRQRPLPGDNAGDGGMASLGALFSKALQ